MVLCQRRSVSIASSFTLHGPYLLLTEGHDTAAAARFEDSLRVNKLHLRPDYQNRRNSAGLHKSVIERASLLGIPIRLRVLTTNPALKFDLRAGFSVEAETAERRTLVINSHLQFGI